MDRRTHRLQVGGTDGWTAKGRPMDLVRQYGYFCIGLFDTRSDLHAMSDYLFFQQAHVKFISITNLNKSSADIKEETRSQCELYIILLPQWLNKRTYKTVSTAIHYNKDVYSATLNAPGIRQWLLVVTR